MACAGVGIGILEVARMDRALNRRPSLARRFFTDRSSGHFIVITVHYAYFNAAHRSSGPASMHVQGLGR